MSVGTALRDARREQGLSAEALAERVPYSREMIQKVERGERKVAKDMRETLGRALDDPNLYLALAHEATGGVMTPPVLSVEQHRMVLKDLFLVELAEAKDALHKATRALIKTRTTDADREAVKAALIEVAEAVTAGENLLATMARTYKISLADLWDEHQERLVEAGYLEKRKRPASCL